MDTVYNLLTPNNSVKNGIIEIFNMYDYHYYLICVDGKIIEEISNDYDYKKTLTDPKFIKKAVRHSGILFENFIFVHYEFELFARSLGDYDQNNFGYVEIYKLIKFSLSNPSHLEKLHKEIL